MASQYDELIRAAIGPAYWNHVADCECAMDAPENEDAFMTRDCLINYHTGSMEQVNRGRALQELCQIIERQARDNG